MRPSKASLEPREERTGGEGMLGEGRAEDERREDGRGKMGAEGKQTMKRNSTYH